MEYWSNGVLPCRTADEASPDRELRTVNRKPLAVQWATAATRRSLPTMATP